MRCCCVSTYFFHFNEIHTLLHLVRTGRWVAILVDSITHGEEGLCAVPLREAALPMPVVWLYPKDIDNMLPNGKVAERRDGSSCLRAL